MNTRNSALLGVLILAAIQHATAHPYVYKVQLASLAVGGNVRVGTYPNWQGGFQSDGWLAHVRGPDVAFGVRLSPKYALAVEVIIIDQFVWSYYRYGEAPVALGLTLARCTEFGPAPRAVALTATVHGSNLWRCFGSGLRYLDLHVGANVTCWVVNPELDVGFRREWNPGVYNPSYNWPPYVDCAYAVVRVGLGGWYEHGSAPNSSE